MEIDPNLNHSVDILSHFRWFFEYLLLKSFHWCIYSWSQRTCLLKYMSISFCPVTLRQELNKGSSLWFIFPLLFTLSLFRAPGRCMYSFQEMWTCSPNYVYLKYKMGKVVWVSYVRDNIFQTINLAVRFLDGASTLWDRYGVPQKTVSNLDIMTTCWLHIRMWALFMRRNLKYNHTT